MDTERYYAEYEVLRKNLPPNQYKFHDVGTPNAHIVMGIRTDGDGRLYTIYIELKDFPYSVPRVYVTQMLRNYRGEEMNSPSHSMHTLQAHPDRHWTQICHYDADEWEVGIPLLLVYIRAKMWLEIYEQHLRTGNEINYYLKSKSKQ